MGSGNIGGSLLHAVRGIGHCHTRSYESYHLSVIFTVSKGSGGGRVYAAPFQDIGQS